MFILDKFDFEIEAAVRYFERVNVDLYAENNFGFANPLQSMLQDVYNTEVLVTPEFVIFVDADYFYNIPVWMADFMHDVIRHSYGFHITREWVVGTLKDMIVYRSNA